MTFIKSSFPFGEGCSINLTRIKTDGSNTIQKKILIKIIVAQKSAMKLFKEIDWSVISAQFYLFLENPDLLWVTSVQSI